MRKTTKTWSAAAAAVAAAAVVCVVLAQGPKEAVRPPAVAGQFYPGSAAALEARVAAFLADVGPVEASAGRPIASVAPHAGYDYSGATAAAVYKRFEHSKARRVVVIGPSHYGGLSPSIWVDDVDAYDIPGARVPVDRAALLRLAEAGLPALVGRAPSEHCIEVELPFLGAVIEPGWQLVPVLVATDNPDRCKTAAAAIRTILDDGTIVCVSSDFTHYGSAYGYVPFGGTDEEIAAKLATLDGEAADLVTAKDADGFTAFLRRTGDTICGRGAILVLLNLLPEGARGTKVAYTTSGEKTGSFSTSVSYVGIVFTAQPAEDVWHTGKTEGSPMSESALTDAAKATLLTIARASLVASVTGKEMGPESDFELTPALKEKRGAFVTLTENGQLRGCIGYVQPMAPLWKAVADNAANAALRDPRFQRVQPQELERISIEISAMSPLKTITDPSVIQVGRDGIMISRGFAQGLLLPQVATEYGWDRETFLQQTCRKAGLPSDAWKDPEAKIEIFSAEVFGEEKEAAGSGD